MVYNWLKRHLSRILPQQCLLCLASINNASSLCPSCQNDLPVNYAHCIICSVPLIAAQYTASPLRCGKCQKSPPHYTTSFIPYIYASPLNQLISQFKFNANMSYVPLLADSFLKKFIPRQSLPECIIPVPLHSQRLHERGFNQSIELARLIAKPLNIHVDSNVVTRNKQTQFQSALNSKQRQQNLKNAFSISKKHHYKHVAILDDVVTTGTTVNELSKILRNSGVEIIEVWALARTPDKASS
ncbi:MAG: ComF family protein [Woeseiaceae bacterium]